MEQKILAALANSREAWALAAPHVDPDKTLSPEGATVFREISAYYEADKDATAVDREILAARIERAVTSNKLANRIVQIVRTLPEVSANNIVKEVISLKAHAVGQQIASKFAAGKQDDSILKLMSEYQDLVTRDSLANPEDEDEVTALKVEDLLGKHYDKSNLIQIWPPELNRQIDGGAKPGHHILVFAPTEMGKTLFTINMVAGFLKQGLKVLYIGNEDPLPDILMRVMTRLTGLTKYEIQENPAKAQAILDKRNYDKLTIASLAPGTFPRIHRLIEKYEPQVVVLDQLRNLDVASENRTQALEKAATEARNTAKRFGVLVVSVTQAADSASGKRVLNRGDVDSSNVGIPGQVDLMIGIGADEEMEGRNMRMLSFPKNKLSGNHEPISVTVDPYTSRVDDGTAGLSDETKTA